MKALVMYESMYGNTHLIADAVAEGLREAGNDVRTVAVADATPALLDGIDLLVAGGPTHVHSMSRPSTRKAAVEAAEKPEAELVVDPDAEGPGLREFFDEVNGLPRYGAAYDTRIDAPPIVTGHASKAIAKQMRKHGCTMVATPESFLVTKENHLLESEIGHARTWGAQLRADMQAAQALTMR